MANSAGGAGAGGAPQGDSVVILATDPDPAAGGKPAPAGSPPAAAAKRPAKPRAHFIDWLRVFLTVEVLVHHCFNTYVFDAGERYWFARFTGQPDYTTWTLQNVIVGGPSMPMAMCLFFLLAGYFTPGSYNRKGPLHHVLDRCIRLLIPVVVYAVLISPLLLVINAAAGIAPDNPSPFAAVRGEPHVWRFYFSHFFHICPGPTWFIWCLLWFDVGYVLCRLVAGWAAAARARWRSRRSAASGDKDAAAAPEQLPACGLPVSAPPPGAGAAKAPAGGERAGELPMPRVLAGGAALIAAFALTSWGALLATYTSHTVAGGQDGFWVPCWLVGFRPSWIGPNAISFIIGTQAQRLDLLRRLPARLGWWCLCAAGVWWAEACVMTDLIARPASHWGQLPISGFVIGHTLWRKFAEWSFAVVWGTGLLVVFRETFNAAPGRVGRLVIAGAYGAFIIHPVFIALWGWALAGVPFVTTAGNAIASAPLVVVCAWLLTLLVRLVPGVTRVLG